MCEKCLSGSGRAEEEKEIEKDDHPKPSSYLSRIVSSSRRPSIKRLSEVAN